MTQTISAIHTPCKKCVFAIYNNITQTGCALDLIAKYKTRNIEVLDVYDNDKEFYVINNKKCHGYRENSWFKNDELSLEDKIEIVKKSNTLNYLVVINLKSIKLSDLENIISTIKKSDIKPAKLIFIRYSDDNKEFMFDILKPIIENIGIPWRLQTMVDDYLGWNDIIYQISAHNAQYRFICLINGVSEQLNNLINKANNIVYNQLDQFKILCDNTEKTAVLYPGSVYRYAAAHGINILDDSNYYEYL